MSDKTATKAENFMRLAQNRTEVLLDQCRKLSNLSSGNYEYSPAQVEKMFAAIESAVAASKAKFTGTKAKERFTF